MANEETNVNIEAEEQAFNELIKLRRQKLADAQAKGKDPFDVYKVNRTHTSGQIKENYDELENQTVTVAGRIMSKRVQGKAGLLISMTETVRFNYILKLMM